MLRKLYNYYKQTKLTNKDYSFLFAKPAKNEYIAFDTETTGLDPKKDSILSIGAVKIKSNTILKSEKVELFVNPHKDVAEKSIKIHGLRNIDLLSGIDIQTAINVFLHFIGARPLVGYYVAFDVAIVNKYVKTMLGITLPNKQIEVSTMYRKRKTKLMHGGKGELDLSFDAIMKELNLPILEKHDAVNDAIMSAMIFLKLKKSLF